ATRRLSLGGIRHAPAALQGGLAQLYSSTAGDYPQLVPAPLQHWHGELNSGTAERQACTLGGDGEHRSALDRQDGLRPSVEQPGLDANDACTDRARRAA